MIARMVRHDVEHYPDTESMGLVDHRRRIGERAEHRLDVAIVGDVVAGVGLRRRVPRVDPDGIDAESGQYGEPGTNAVHVAEPVAVLVGEGPDVDLIGDGVAPPRRRAGVGIDRAPSVADRQARFDVEELQVLGARRRGPRCRRAAATVRGSTRARNVLVSVSAALSVGSIATTTPGSSVATWRMTSDPSPSRTSTTPFSTLSTLPANGGVLDVLGADAHRDLAAFVADERRPVGHHRCRDGELLGADRQARHRLPSRWNVPRTRFIDGEPMKLATNRLCGWS